MKSSNEDRTEGRAKDLKGNLKEGAGRALGNREMEAEGRGDQAEGKVQEKAGEVKKVFNR